MNKLAIVADTTQDLTFEIGKEYGIEVISYSIQMGEKHYKDQVDITTRQFYEKMENYEVLSSGVPPLQDVIDRLDQLSSDGYTQALLITSAAKLTGMRQLYEVLLNQYEDLDLFVFETSHIGSTAGLHSIYAAELRDAGKAAEEILQELERVNQKASIFALFRSLKYVIKGGRLNKYAGMIGTMLNINPLLTIQNSEITIINKARGKKKSYQSLVTAVQKELNDTSRYKLVIFAGNNDEETAELEKDLANEIKGAETFYATELTPVLGVHGGPKSVGVSILKID
ncbi:DegV family protein [Facklamia lactis]|uniref:DegV family protein n=1 Tax=Facklamia lactis TaxID=2749967 RepID=UPI0018CD96FC|nr:DegV family protein [Facklamia lactis]MBG9980321.1 DegV family protein [Facklamia lactis]